MSFVGGIADRVFGQEMSEAVAAFEDNARSFARHHLVNDNMPPEDARMQWSELREQRRAAGPDWQLDPSHGIKPTMRPK